jgi:hypothetical protein
MKDRNRVIAIGLLTATALCWVIFDAQNPIVRPMRVQARQPSSRPLNPPPPSNPPRPSTESTETSAPSDPAEPETTTTGVDPGPVKPLPRPVSLSAMAELPPAPITAASVDSDGSPVPPVTALENLRSALHQFAARFGGNPVGENAEITAALTGRNGRQQVFVSTEDGLRTDSQGRLIDPWGTPYFFHQLSRTETEIRSAGPDRRMWTSDDLVIK